MPHSSKSNTRTDRKVRGSGNLFTWLQALFELHKYFNLFCSNYAISLHTSRKAFELALSRKPATKKTGALEKAHAVKQC